MNQLTEFRKEFDREIEKYLNTKINQVVKIDPKAVDLIKIIKEFIKYGGKRIRPALFYFAYKSYSSFSLSEIFRLSLIFELIQAFALIHDDIIDHSDLRRANPTVYKRYGLETAILVGDLALMLADETFYLHVKNKSLVMHLYNQTKQEMIFGEYLDLKKIDDVNKIMDLKTAGYSFVRPVSIGLTLANVSKKEIQTWEYFLKKIGILFQIKDDFLGTFGEEKIIGKSTDSDIKEGKKTLLVAKFLEKSSLKEKDYFLSFFGRRKISDKQIEDYKNLLRIYKIDEETKGIIIQETKKVSYNLHKYFFNKPLTVLLQEILLKISSF